MNGIIIFKSNPCNIGDYMQSLAASKFFSKTDYYIEREEISSFKSTLPTKVIMNAWWMWSNNWPPSESIIPLFISIHIAPEASKWMLSPKGIAYFKQHEPIGCRDLHTMDILKEKGINCYFSGCLTLTLGQMYKLDKISPRKGIIICDPYYKINIKSLLFGRCNILKLAHIYSHNKDFFLRIQNTFGYRHKMFSINNKYIKSFFKKLQLAYFYQVYTQLFTKELIENATYTSQWIENQDLNNEQLLKKAEKLLFTYAHAKMVITSRIHCALPSIGCNTPVLFIMSEELKSKVKTKVGGRLGGIETFFNTIIYKNEKLHLSIDNNFHINSNKISSSLVFSNKSTYRDYANNLIKKCKTFTQQLSSTQNHD